MTSIFLRTLIITMLGRASNRPLRDAAFRICGALVIAGGTGVLLGGGIARAQLPQDLPGYFAVLSVHCISLILVSLVLTLVSATFYAAHHQDGLRRMATVLPLLKLERWLLVALPAILVASITVVFSVPLVLQLARGTSVPFAYLMAGHLAGVVAGIGFALNPRVQSLFGRGLMLIAITIASTKLLELLITSAGEATLAYMGMLGLITLDCLAGARASYRTPHVVVERQRRSPRAWLPRQLLNQWWFAQKTLRNKRTAGSLVFCLVLSAGCAAALWLRDLQGARPEGWLLFGAILAAAFVSDMRGISRKYRVPEIVAVKDVDHFVKSQLRASVVLALLIGMPLYLCVAPAMGFALASLVFLALQSFAAVAGLLASTIFAPKNGDIGSQFFAAMFSAGLLFGVPRLMDFSRFSNAGQAANWLLFSLMGVLVIYVIEQLRRRRYVYA